MKDSKSTCNSFSVKQLNKTRLEQEYYGFYKTRNKSYIIVGFRAAFFLSAEG